MNGISCDRFFTAVAAVREHTDKYEKNFDTVVTFLTQCINKKAPTLSVKVASVSQTRPVKQQKISDSCGTLKENIELKKYSREEYDSMWTAQNQQLYELQKKAGLIKGKKTSESSRSLEARVDMLEAKTNNNNDATIFLYKNPKDNDNNRNNPTLDRK